MSNQNLEAALNHEFETESVEYKASITVGSTPDWLEVIKDIVAIANSGGGYLIFGVDNNGKPNDFDCATLATIDPADLTDRLFKYTRHQSIPFAFYKPQKEGKQLFAIEVTGVQVPIVFVKPGTYDIGGGKQKSAFSAGTIYFRHGAKSEPGNSDDLRVFIDRRYEEFRKSWVDALTKFAAAPRGSQVDIVTALTDERPISVRITNDLSAPVVGQIPINESHPYRQKEIIEEFNKSVDAPTPINHYDLECVRHAYNIDDNAVLCQKIKHASNRYSKAFLDWLIQKYQEDDGFIRNARSSVRGSTAGI